MPYNLCEYVDNAGRPVFRQWRGGLQKAQQAQLDNKLNLLKLAGSDLPPGLLAGTRGSGHIKKLKVKGPVQLRPRLCAGPINHDTEFTLLIGAVERDWKTVPPDADELAAERRAEILASVERRCVYVP